MVDDLTSAARTTKAPFCRGGHCIARCLQLTSRLGNGWSTPTTSDLQQWRKRRVRLRRYRMREGQCQRVRIVRTVHATLRAKGVSLKRIAAEIGVGVGTIYRVALEGSKIRERVF